MLDQGFSRTSLPIELGEPGDVPVKGEWFITEDQKPAWKWSFHSGRSETVSVIDVCRHSTQHSNRDHYLVHVFMKVNSVYDMMGLEKPDGDALIEEINKDVMVWASQPLLSFISTEFVGSKCDMIVTLCGHANANNFASQIGLMHVQWCLGFDSCTGC